MDLTSSRSGRRVLFAALYLLEGAPIGFVWWAIPTLLRERGVALDRITALSSTLALPWALKFLWAPLVDRCRGRRFGRRGWILASQAVMVASLAPLLVVGLGASLPLLFGLLCLHAFAAATQDVAIDALAIDSSDEVERGSLNGWMQAGLLFGRWLMGGAALEARGRLGDRGVLAVLVAGLLMGMLLALAYRDRFGADRERAPIARTLGLALCSRHTWVALAFAATAGAGFEAVGGLARPLLVDAGATAEEIGRALGFWAVVAMGIGALAGGRLSDRWGRRRSIVVAGLGLATTVATFALLLRGAAGVEGLGAAAILVYLGIGVFTATTYALFMDLTDPVLGGTQFSAYMGATNLCEIWAVRAAGRFAQAGAAARGFLILDGVAVVALLLLFFLPPSSRAFRRRLPSLAARRETERP